MDYSLREIRFFVAAAHAGSFTAAAADLYVSQAAVSRTIASLERSIGDRLLRRVPRGCEVTSAGQQLLPYAEKLLAEADRFTEFARSRRSLLRLGYAWAALGKHTARMQREWTWNHPDVDLALVRRFSATSGLEEGQCDVAIVRRDVTDLRFDSVVVGLERRMVAFASDDDLWARRRVLNLGEIAPRTIVIDPRVGTTHPGLWANRAHQPSFIEAHDVDNWLDTIAAGQGVGITAEATAHHHQRPGVVYRYIKDGPRIPVKLMWWSGDPPTHLGELVDDITRLYA